MSSLLPVKRPLGLHKFRGIVSFPMKLLVVGVGLAGCIGGVDGSYTPFVFFLGPPVFFGRAIISVTAPTIPCTVD